MTFTKKLIFEIDFEYESELGIQKFKTADLIWRTKMQKVI